MPIHSLVTRFLPASWRRKVRCLVADLTRDELTPPDRHIRIVGADILSFRQIGANWREAFIREAGPRSDERVLDVGSGCGRTAVALTSHLGPSGSYEGLEIVEPAVRWCQKQITPRFPTFRFTRADVRNDLYNRTGKFRASEYPFPFRNGEFDFVLLTSVFTHMLRPDVEHYLREIARVLKDGGRCFSTFCLLTDHSRKVIAAGQAPAGLNRLVHPLPDGCLVVDPDNPEDIIAYPQEDVERMFAAAGIPVTVVRHGSWCGTPGAVRAQDIVIGTRGAKP
jgi:SAM-dependent methyltransferase